MVCRSTENALIEPLQMPLPSAIQDRFSRAMKMWWAKQESNRRVVLRQSAHWWAHVVGAPRVHRMNIALTILQKESRKRFGSEPKTSGLGKWPNDLDLRAFQAAMVWAHAKAGFGDRA